MLFERFGASAGVATGRSGIRHAGTVHAYSALYERAERVAAGLMARGIGGGDAVGLLLPSSPDFFVLSYALLALGAIVVPLDLLATPTELESAAAKCGVRAVICRADLTAAGQRLTETLGPRALPLMTTGEGGTLAELEKSAPTRLPAVPADAVAVYLLSSGSTGRPKVVPHTHGQILTDVDACVPVFDYRPDDVMLSVMPAYHAMGFALTMCHAAQTGVTTLLWSDPQPLPLAKARLLATIAQERVTLLPGVPFLFDLLCSVPEAADLSSVRIAYSGAIALKRPTFDNVMSRFGLPIRQAYGTTETLVAAYNDDPDPAATWNSVGRPTPGTSIEVLPVEDSGNTGIGELLVTSPAVITGYLDNPEANAASFQEGGWLSGDLGRLDDAGRVYITGRKKLILEVVGQKVDPLEIEDVLVAHPAVAEAVVVGIRDPHTGEQRLKAVVVRKGEETADGIVRFARSRLSAHKVPYIVEFRDALPRSGTGKILRGKLVD